MLFHSSSIGGMRGILIQHEDHNFPLKVQAHHWLPRGMRVAWNSLNMLKGSNKMLKRNERKGKKQKGGST